MNFLTSQTVENECLSLLRVGTDQGVVHQTIRKFATMKTLVFISLKLDIVSDECISWVLQSLRNDDMTPTERAI